MSSEDVSLRELAEFLEPTTRLDVRRAALDVVINASAQLDGSAETIFQANENAIGKVIIDQMLLCRKSCYIVCFKQ